MKSSPPLLVMDRLSFFVLIGAGALGMVLSPPAGAESRSWRSASGNRSFRAEFVSSDGKRVVLRRLDGKSVTVALANLHASDRAWLRNHLKKKEVKAPGGLQGECFDTLSYGDGRKTVERKLEGSLVATKTLDDRLVGRTGLNGIYKTRIGKDSYEIFFHWTENDKLQEVTLRSRTVGQAEYNKALKETWTNLISLLRRHHGAPVQVSQYPNQQLLGDGKLLGTHLWHTPNQHSILLCTGRERTGYLVSIRFSADLIPPNNLENNSPPAVPEDEEGKQ